MVQSKEKLVERLVSALDYHCFYRPVPEARMGIRGYKQGWLAILFRDTDHPYWHSLAAAF
jgi:hypothetical protein